MPLGNGIGISPIFFNRTFQTFLDKLLGIARSDLIALWPLNEVPESEQDYLEFNGTSTVVTIPDATSIQNVQDGIITWDGWYLADSLGENNSGRFVNKGDQNGVGWNAHITNGRVNVKINCATTDAVSQSSTNVNDGAWHHIAFYFNDAGDRKIYITIDGVWETSYGVQNAGVGAIVSDVGEALQVGNWGTARTWDGYIGWVRLSNNDRLGVGVNFTPPPRTTIPTVDANTVGLWPFNEGVGSVTFDLSDNQNEGIITDGDWPALPVMDNLQGDSDLDGNYSSVRINNDITPFICTYFDGSISFGDIYSTKLNTNFPSEEGTLQLIIKIRDTADWLGTAYMWMVQFESDSGDYLCVRKQSASEQIRALFVRNGNTNSLAMASGGTGNWLFITITWNKSENRCNAYLNGSPVNDTTLAGTWSGNLVEAGTNIGARTEVLAYPWNGYISTVGLWKKELTSSQVADMYSWSGLS